jgi:hypothetical protein
MPIVHLAERSLLKVSGPDARKFLDGLVTNDMDAVTPEKAGFGALLTAQGKIISDFFVVALPDEDGGGFVLDCPAAMAPDLAKRLMLYKLRAKLAIEDLSETAAVVASADGGALPPDCGVVFADPRSPALGQRAIVAKEDAPGLADASEEDYLAHRLTVGMPEGGKDFGYGGSFTFPHEAMMDQNGGVSFRKGCYVGQEVVSRMQHRGTARTRCVPVVFDGGIRSEWGVDVLAGEKKLGEIGSTAKGRGMAMVRLDRWADALAAGETITGGGLAITLVKPGFAAMPFPGEAGFGEAKA